MDAAQATERLSFSMPHIQQKGKVIVQLRGAQGDKTTEISQISTEHAERQNFLCAPRALRVNFSQAKPVDGSQGRQEITQRRRGEAETRRKLLWFLWLCCAFCGFCSIGVNLCHQRLPLSKTVRPSKSHSQPQGNLNQAITGSWSDLRRGDVSSGSGGGKSQSAWKTITLSNKSWSEGEAKIWSSV